MDCFELGHNVFEPEPQKKSGVPRAMTIIGIKEKGARPYPYFVLAPLTVRGWPSVNARNWRYYQLAVLPNLTRIDDNPAILGCPDCQVTHKILYAGCRLVDQKTDTYQCKKCKQRFILQVAGETNGE